MTQYRFKFLRKHRGHASAGRPAPDATREINAKYGNSKSFNFDYSPCATAAQAVFSAPRSDQPMPLPQACFSVR